VQSTSTHKGQGNFALQPTTKAQRQNKSIALRFFNFDPRCGGWLTPRSGRFNPLKRDPSTHRVGRLGGPQVRYGRMQKISHLPGFDPRKLHLAVSRYTDWAIPAHPQALIPKKNVSRKEALIAVTKCIGDAALRMSKTCIKVQKWHWSRRRRRKMRVFDLWLLPNFESILKFRLPNFYVSLLLLSHISWILVFKLSPCSKSNLFLCG